MGQVEFNKGDLVVAKEVEDGYEAVPAVYVGTELKTIENLEIEMYVFKTLEGTKLYMTAGSLPMLKVLVAHSP